MNNIQEPKILQIIDNLKDKRKNICIVMPTYNQYNETKKNIDLLKKQTLVPDIIIVDNNPNDGTFDKFSKEYDDIILIKSVKNYGGAGGFYLGQKYAYDNGYEWIILNDNDAYPLDNDLIKKILSNSSIFVSANPTNIAEQSEDFKYNYICTFHYNIYNRNFIEKNGFVDYKLFIYGDEVEYYNRTIKNNLVYKKIPNKYFHPLKSFYASKMVYFLVRNNIYNNTKYAGFKKLIFNNIIFTFSFLIYKYLWGFKNYYYFFKRGLIDIFKNDFSKNLEIINSKFDDGIKFNELKIEDFLNIYNKNNDKTLFSLKKITSGEDVSYKLNIKNIEIPRKEIFGKKTLITNLFNDPYRVVLSFYFNKVIFIKDIYWDRNCIEFFELNNSFSKKISTLFIFLLHIPFIILISLILRFKKL